MTFTTLCGCVIISDNLGAYKIEYCPKHKAAPGMYEALEAILGDRNSALAREKGWKALAKAGERCIP